MPVPFTRLERRCDVVHVREPAAAEIDGGGAKRPCRSLRLLHHCKATSQGIVDEVFERYAEVATQLFQPGRDVIIERQGRSHASKHTNCDVLMSKTIRKAKMPVLLGKRCLSFGG